MMRSFTYSSFILLGVAALGVSLGLTAQTLGKEKANQLVTQMAALQAMTESDLRQFDREIEDQGFVLQESPSYERLLAARVILESLEDQMESRLQDGAFYGELKTLLENSSDKKLPTQAPSMEELVPVVRDVTQENWRGVFTQVQTQAGGVALKGLQQEVRVQLASLRKDMSSYLVHLVGGSFHNITGSGFSRGRWALTFDDGPHASRTKQVINNLQRYGYSATFFELAQNVKRLPSVTRLVLNAGMEVGNHSYNHPNMAKLGHDGLMKQIFTSSDIIESVTGHRLKYFRLPYGSGQSSSRIRQMLSQRGLTHVAWNVDTLDWRDHNPQSIYNRAVRQMKNQGGGVILFHDIHSQSVKASEILMREMRAGHLSGNLTTVSAAR